MDALPTRSTEIRMELIYCPNCGKRSGFKRALGFGTLFMVVITLGLWLLIIPFYPARCINCGMTRGSAFWENLKSNPRMAVTTSSVLFGLVVVFVIFRAMTPESAPNYHGISDAVHESASAVPEPRGSDLHRWEPAAPSPQLPALSSDELQTLKDGRQYDLELIAAVNAVLMAPSPNDAITAYCRFTMKGVRENSRGGLQMNG